MSEPEALARVWRADRGAIFFGRASLFFQSLSGLTAPLADASGSVLSGKHAAGGHLAGPLMLTLARFAAAVKAVCAADGISIRQNNESHGGQDVFHMHFHVVPRFAGDGFTGLARSLGAVEVPLAERIGQARVAGGRFRSVVARLGDFHCMQIAAENYLATYTLNQAGRSTRRATIWRRTAGGWQIVYYQGTEVAVSDGM
jgi:hypothetical protein